VRDVELSQSLTPTDPLYTPKPSPGITESAIIRELRMCVPSSLGCVLGSHNFHPAYFSMNRDSPLFPFDMREMWELKGCSSASPRGNYCQNECSSDIVCLLAAWETKNNRKWMKNERGQKEEKSTQIWIIITVDMMMTTMMMMRRRSRRKMTVFGESRKTQTTLVVRPCRCLWCYAFGKLKQW